MLIKTFKPPFPEGVDDNGAEHLFICDGENYGDDIIAVLKGQGYSIAHYRSKSTAGAARMIKLDPIADRMTNHNYDPETFMAALKWGQKYAEIMVEADQ